MNEPTPRRSLVPGPGTNQGIAAQAIAMREEKAKAIQGLADNLPTLRRPQEPPLRVMVQPAPLGNLTKAVASVMANVGTIQKGGFNRFHNYHYARMEDLLVVLTPLIGKAGLTIFQNEIEIKQVENRVAVTYEFIIAHESGEQAPPQRFTGMCMARNSKGDWDDKCLNKCHTQARKYFLLSMFQVPAGDFDEADTGPAQEDTNQRPEKAPVPGPTQERAPERSAIDQAAQQAARASQKAAEDGIPHKIILGQGAGADQWANAFIKAIGKCMSQDEIKQWDAANDQALQSMSQHYPEVYEAIEAAVIRRTSDLQAAATAPKPGLGNGSGAMPDPKVDAQEAMNWVAAQLAQLKSWEGAKAFWNQYVAPRDKEFDQLDWEMLMEEWKRTETRLAPPDDEPDATNI
jgi:hypothetical protein